MEQKLHEIVQLSSENELVRQDAARQVARTKERCETIRRTMQEQIADMEKQLAQCRAIARGAQKDRDEVCGQEIMQQNVQPWKSYGKKEISAN